MFDQSNFRCLTRDMFDYPDRLDYSVLLALDTFIHGWLFGRPVTILSDFRPGDARQHGLGRAIDLTVPGADSLIVWDDLQKCKLFSGLGIYLNDKGVVSFHVDTRLGRGVDDPALWGDYITHPFDPVTGDHVRADSYTTAGAVVGMIKKNGTLVLMVAVLSASVLWVLTRQ